MADVKVEVNMDSVEKAIYSSPGTKPALLKMGQGIARQANSIGAGYKTPRWHDHKTGEVKGGKSPEYGATAGTRKCICIVHPENYAAMKDNYKHNTLLKASGGR